MCLYFRQYIERRHANAEIGQNIDYEFGDSSDCIELILDHNPQKYSFTGWTIQSRMEPCKVSTYSPLVYFIVFIAVI